MRSLVFGMKALDWNAAQHMTFTAIELCAADAVNWLERENKQKKRRDR